MSDQPEFDFEVASGDAELLTRLFESADQVLIKKLSNNDRDWASFSNKHQAGVYMPREQRDSGFFPPLALKDRKDDKPDEILEAFFLTHWPQTAEHNKKTRLVNYRSKGEETHMTGLSKTAFADLLPASYLVMGRIYEKHESVYECLTIDSGSDEASLLIDLFELGPDFLIGIFDPVARKRAELDKVLDFAEMVIRAWLDGQISTFAKSNAALPTTAELAHLALQTYLTKHGLEVLNPFDMSAPGDALREISRAIEWDLFRQFQRKERSVELVRLVLGDKPMEVNITSIIRRLVDELPAIDAMMLSASQQRKSRAGYSYEHHIEAMLLGGKIPFEKQVILASKKRPDFILPSLSFIDSGEPGAESGLILSAKTTLRERWKQVEREKGSRQLYLTTVDENISGSVIQDMASFGVSLVIPETLQSSKETEYKGHKNVLSFQQFCSDVIKPNLELWDKRKS